MAKTRYFYWILFLVVVLIGAGVTWYFAWWRNRERYRSEVPPKEDDAESTNAWAGKYSANLCGNAFNTPQYVPNL